MSALLINHPNKNNEFICNICSNSIENNKIIGLKCNVKKHVFCYDCISDWYKVIKNSMKSNINCNYNFIRMCPICRRNGGYLPNLNNKFISEIHYSKKNEDIKQTCGYALKSKNNFCMNLGQKCFNNLCKKHFNIELKKIEKNENNQSCEIKNKSKKEKKVSKIRSENYKEKIINIINNLKSNIDVIYNCVNNNKLINVNDYCNMNLTIDDISNNINNENHNESHNYNFNNSEKNQKLIKSLDKIKEDLKNINENINKELNNYNEHIEKDIYQSIFKVNNILEEFMVL